LECGCDVENLCACHVVADFIQRTESALERSVGTKVICRGFSRKWYDDEVKELVKKRRGAYRRFRETGSEADSAAYRELRRDCQRAIREKKKQQWCEYLDDLGGARKDNHKLMWSLMKRLVPSNKKVSISPILNSNGVIVSSEEEIIGAWGDHQRTLATPTVEDWHDEEFSALLQQDLEGMNEAPTRECFSKDFTEEEIKEVVEATGYHKSAADDGTKNPMYKCGGQPMREQLGKLFNYLKELELTPANWSRATAVQLYKKGDPADPNNYRGISLISCLGKIYTSLWARRLTKYMESRITENQGGFRPRRSTEDQALLLREILQRRLNAKVPSYLYFVDFRKAFDTVWHDGLWFRLAQEGITGKPWRIIREIYGKSYTQVRVGDKLTEPVKSERGVRQGCPLSPVLFNIFIDLLSQELRASGYGEGIDELHSLLYADDVVILADTPERLQELIAVVNKFCQQWRMDINLTKSKAMVVGKPVCVCECNGEGSGMDGDMDVVVGDVSDGDDDVIGCDCHCMCPIHNSDGAQKWTSMGREVPVVESYQYLGIWFNSTLTWDDHLEYMVSTASRRQRSIIKLLSNKRVAVGAKLLVWTCYVRPLLEYGCVVWKANQKQSARLEAIQHRALTLILKVNEKAKREAVRSLAKIMSLRTRWAGFRLRYYAKVFSFDEGRLIRQHLHHRQGVRVGRCRDQWLSEVRALIKKHDKLKAAHGVLMEYVNRFNGVLPASSVLLDPEDPDSELVNPLGRFNESVEKWMWEQERQALVEVGRPGKTAHLLARVAENEKEQWPYRLRMFKSPTGEGDKIRLRLLSGTSGLNSTLHRFREERASYCPWEACHDGKVSETIGHFCLDCPQYSRLRDDFREGMRTDCSCRGEVSCSDFFDTLNDDDKILFMMGMPVEGREAEPLVDIHSQEYVRRAYTKRKQALDRRYRPDGDEDLSSSSEDEVDLTDVRVQARPQGAIQAAFARQMAQVVQGGLVSSVPSRPLFPLFARSSSSSRNASSPSNGSGSNGRDATECN
jgi:hypothetical protein